MQNCPYHPHYGETEMPIPSDGVLKGPREKRERSEQSRAVRIAHALRSKASTTSLAIVAALQGVSQFIEEQQ